MSRAAALPRPRLRRLRLRPPRLGRTTLIVVAVLAVLAGAGWWAKGSPLLAVKRAIVTGVSGPQAGAIEQRLRSAAIGMSTLGIDTERLQAAVAGYPTVRTVTASGSPPHAVTIHVTLGLPVATLVNGQTRTAVAGDGRLLPGIKVDGDLPQVSIAAIGGGDRVTDHKTIAVLRAIDGAPAALRGRIAFAGVADDTGVTIQLRGGPALRFGGDERLRAKWAAAAAVLADPQAGAATYIDVRYPERPAAGGLKPAPATGDPESQPEP